MKPSQHDRPSEYDIYEMQDNEQTQNDEILTARETKNQDEQEWHTLHSEILDHHQAIEQGAVIDTTDTILWTKAEAIKLGYRVAETPQPQDWLWWKMLTSPSITQKDIPNNKESKNMTLAQKIGIWAWIIWWLYVGYQAWKGIKSLWDWAFWDEKKEEKKKESTDADDKKADNERQWWFLSTAREWTKNLAIGWGILLAWWFIAKQLGLQLPSRLSRWSLSSLVTGNLSKEKQQLQQHIDEMTKRLEEAKKRLSLLTWAAKDQTEQAINEIEQRINEAKKKLRRDDTNKDENNNDKDQKQKDEARAHESIDHKRDEFVSKQKDAQRKKWEEITKQSIDPAKWSTARDKRTKANKEKITALTTIDETGWGLVSTGLEITALPAKMIFSYVLTLIDEWVMDRSDLALIPLDQAKEWVFSFGKSIPTLFGNAWDYCRGEITLEEIAKEINNTSESLSPESRMNLWASLYRHGWLIKTLSQWIGTMTGHLTKLILEWWSTSLGSIDALLAWVTQNMDKQTKILAELEKTLAGTAHLGPIMQNYTETFTILKQNTIIINALNTPWIHTIDDLESLMKKNWQWDLFDDVVRKITSKAWLGNESRFASATKTIIPGTPLTELRSIFGDACLARTQDMLAHGEALQEWWTAWFKKQWAKLNPRAYATHYTYHKQLTTTIQSLAKTQERLLQSNKAWNIISNLFHRSKQGLILQEMLKTNGHIKLHLSSVTDAQEFFANIKTLSLHAPELLGMLAKSLPLIFVWWEIIQEMEKEDSSLGASLLKGFGSLIPFVWPIMLVSHSTQFGKDFDLSSVDRAGAWFGVWLVWYDTFRLAKNISMAKILGQSTPAALWRFMTEPIRDVWYIAKKMAIDVPSILWKFAKDGRRVLATWWTTAFFKEWLRFAKGSSKRLALLAVLWVWLYGGYKALTDSWDLDAHEQAIIAKIQANPNALNDEIRQWWNEMTTDEQAACIKLAATHKLWCSDEMITVQKKNDWRHILVNDLVHKDTLLDVRDTINEALNKRGESKQCSIGYSHAGKRHIREAITSQGYEQHSPQQHAYDYLASLWYTKKDAALFLWQDTS